MSSALFQNRYKSIVVEEESYLLELVRYIHLNPLRVGVVSDMRTLELYPWTGHATLCGRTSHTWQATDEILRWFARHPRRARTAYRDFVTAGVSQGRRADLQGGGLIRSVGGWQAVQELRRGREAYMADERILGGSDFVEAVLRDAEERGAAQERRQRRPLALSTLVLRVGESFGLSAEAISGRSRIRPAVQARHLVAHLWVERLGRTASELARAWGWSRGQVTWAAKRGAEAARAWGHRIEEWCV